MKSVIKLLLSTLLLMLLFSSCQSNSNVESSNVVAAKSVVREMIDWKGASIGNEIPSWVFDAVDQNYEAISKLPQFENRMIFFAEDQGKNLDMLKSWVNNFNVQSAFSKSVSNFVITKFGGEQSGSKADETSESFLTEMTSTFSKTEINGLSKELDYWVKTRYIDNMAESSEDIYQYFVVYAIDKNELKLQLDRALGLVEAKDESQKKLKAEVSAAIAEVQFFAENQ